MGRPVGVGAQTRERLAVFAVFVGKVLHVAAEDRISTEGMQAERTLVSGCVPKRHDQIEQTQHEQMLL